MSPRASRAPLTPLAAVRMVGLLGVALVLADCGGSNNTSTTTSTNYTVGGTISGLTTSSVVLANGGQTVTVSANATTWSFPKSFTAGSSYAVTIQTQPTGELCAITSGASGEDTGNVGNVTVVCGYGEWTWKVGPNTVNASAVYGTQGAGAATNVPGARQAASSWTDSAGNLWLFGGIGYDSTSGTGYLNDLWEYRPSTQEWTWVGGGSGENASGVYGTQGTAAAGNVPGARYAASTWIDSSGNLWLFGGYGYDSAGSLGRLNDLWRYTPSTQLWTWVSGGNVDNGSAVYGTQGAAAAGNVPGARYSASTWIDSSGNLWLFGGYGDDKAGAVGNLNDLWKFSPSAKTWTWVSGGSADNVAGVYGTQGTAAAGNVPGARRAASAWIDSSGNLWLFGGYGDDSVGNIGRLNDLWEFTPSSAQWTWFSGEDVANVSGSYGSLGVAAATDVPGAREAASAWIDSSGNLWLFGGVGYDANGTVGNLDDIWEFDPSSKQWAWIGGRVMANATGVYGTLGTASVADVIGGRNSMSAWVDSSGNFWLFGGYGYDANGNLGYLNDLWQYNPSAAN